LLQLCTTILSAVMMSPMKEWRDVMLALFSESSLFSAPSNLTYATKSATGVDNSRSLIGGVPRHSSTGRKCRYNDRPVLSKSRLPIGVGQGIINVCSRRVVSSMWARTL